MSLRTKLLLGYLGFIVALGVLGAWSARTLQQMSAVSGRIIAENYDSVVAAQNMKESLERQDSAALFELLGQHARAAGQLAEHRARFDAAFDTAAANITEVGERDVVEAIRRGRDDYYRRYDAFLVATGERTAAYFRDLEPRFNAVRADCDQLLHINQEAMRHKADAASQIARRWFLITLALLCFLLWTLRRWEQKPKIADLLIETESEMRKVTWPSMPEAVNSSIVVIVCVAFLMAFLAGADWFLGRIATQVLTGRG